MDAGVRRSTLALVAVAVLLVIVFFALDRLLAGIR